MQEKIFSSVQEKIFYPRVKSQISLSSVQEKFFYPRVKPQISLFSVQEKIFYPRVKSQISFSGMQEKIFYPRVKSQISISSMQEKIFYPRVKSQISLSSVREKIFYPRVKSQTSFSGMQECGILTSFCSHQDSISPPSGIPVHCGSKDTSPLVHNLPMKNNTNTLMFYFQHLSYWVRIYPFLKTHSQGGQSCEQHDWVHRFPEPVKSFITFVILSQI